MIKPYGEIEEEAVVSEYIFKNDFKGWNAGHIGSAMGICRPAFPQLREPYPAWSWENVLLVTSTPNVYGALKGWTFAKQPDIFIQLENEFIVNLKGELSDLAKKIEDSKYILNLADDWDDEGGAGYSANVWKIAVEFLANYANHILETSSKILETPEIYHGPVGSIDVLWEKKGKYQFLMNIKEDRTVSYYGDNFNDQKVEGTFLTSEFEFILIPFLIYNY